MKCQRKDCVLSCLVKDNWAIAKICQSVKWHWVTCKQQDLISLEQVGMSSHMAWEHINTSLWLPIIEMSDGQVRGLTTNGLGSHVGKPAPAKCSYDFFISILATLDWNVRQSSKRIDHPCCGWASLLQIIRQLQEYNKKTVWEHLCRSVRTSQSTFDSCPVPPAPKIPITSTALQLIAGPLSTYQTIYFLKADDVCYPQTPRDDNDNDKYTHKDKYKDKDKKVPRKWVNV